MERSGKCHKVPLGPLHFLCFIAAMNLILSLTFGMMPSFLMCLGSLSLAFVWTWFWMVFLGASCQVDGWNFPGDDNLSLVEARVTAISCFDLSGVSTWCLSFYPHTVALYEWQAVLLTLFCLERLRLVNKKKQGRKRQRIIARLPRPLALKLAGDLEDAGDAAIENSHLCRDWTDWTWGLLGF